MVSLYLKKWHTIGNCMPVLLKKNKIYSMKKLLTLSFIMVMAVSISFGQFIKEGRASMSEGSYNALSMELRKTEKKDVDKAWAKFASKTFKGGKTSYNKKIDETFTDNGMNRSMGDNDMDVYSKVSQSGENTILTVWIDLGGAYLSSEMHPDQYVAAEKVILDFALSVSKAMLEEQLKEEEKVLKKFEGDLKKLEKDNDGYHRDIVKARELIAEREADIEQNLQDQANKEAEIDTQKQVVNKVEEKIDSID